MSEDPIYFIKSTTSISYENSVIPYPRFNTSAVWTETELGIVISKNCKNIEEVDASQYIKGFFVAGDITCEGIYNRDHHLAFSKSRTGFCPISKNIVSLDLTDKYLNLKTYINGKLLQHGNTVDMIFNPYKTISYISKIVDLQENDIILTGTPTTVNGGPQFDCLVNPGDRIIHSIDELGELSYTFGA